jgi:hypothetical protein
MTKFRKKYAEKVVKSDRQTNSFSRKNMTFHPSTRLSFPLFRDKCSICLAKKRNCSCEMEVNKALFDMEILPYTKTTLIVMCMHDNDNNEEELCLCEMLSSMKYAKSIECNVQWIKSSVYLFIMHRVK